MKKALFCIFTAFAVSVGLFAQQPVVAVAPFNAISGISAADANMITRVFTIRLGNTQKVGFVDRSIVERVLSEHRFQAGDWSNAEKTAELGKALNADWIVRGELEKFGNNILITVQFYDIQTFRFMSGADLRIANVDAAYDNMDPLVNKLVETIAASGSKPRQQSGGASAYYGTWLQRSGSITATLIIDSNRVTIRRSDGGYIVISNCTWTAENNIDEKTLKDYPRGFKVSGIVTDYKRLDHKRFVPVYFFIHSSDRNKIYIYRTPNSKSEIQKENWKIGEKQSEITY
ncbi:MAG: penicillin-binding protein activator LpoB [Treponema sp.]|jgi:TolB-like protein|nr:penicillin-binding protein activator LpoB [Treponema sp.]